MEERLNLQNLEFEETILEHYQEALKTIEDLSREHLKLKSDNVKRYIQIGLMKQKRKLLAK